MSFSGYRTAIAIIALALTLPQAAHAQWGSFRSGALKHTPASIRATAKQTMPNTVASVNRTSAHQSCASNRCGLTLSQPTTPESEQLFSCQEHSDRSLAALGTTAAGFRKQFVVTLFIGTSVRASGDGKRGRMAAGTLASTLGDDAVPTGSRACVSID